MSHNVSHPLVDDTTDQGYTVEPSPAHPDSDAWPDDWKSSSYRRNWHVFVKPLDERLTAPEYHLCRRVVRPKGQGHGLIKRTETTQKKPSGYACELILGELYDEYEPTISHHRMVGKLRGSNDIDSHTMAIATAMQDVIDSRPSEFPSDTTSHADVDPDAFPVTREHMTPVVPERQHRHRK